MQDRRDIMFQDQKSREDLELDQFNKHNSFVPEERALTKAEIRGWYAAALAPQDPFCFTSLSTFATRFSSSIAVW